MREVIITTKRVGYDGSYCLIVPDHAAGNPNRYTVYKIPASPSRRTKIIGRELPLSCAKKIAFFSSRR
jgi:hypothetical protein